jgi:hypothetical protein
VGNVDVLVLMHDGLVIMRVGQRPHSGIDAVPSSESILVLESSARMATRSMARRWRTC